MYLITCPTLTNKIKNNGLLINFQTVTDNFWSYYCSALSQF